MTTFDDFYAAYPKKKARPVAERAWDKHKFTEAQALWVLTQVAKFKESDEWLKDDGTYIPHPATFLNQRRWEDDMAYTKRDGAADTPATAPVVPEWIRQRNAEAGK